MPETRIAIINDPYYIDKNLIDHSLYFLNFWLINANIPHFFGFNRKQMVLSEVIFIFLIPIYHKQSPHYTEYHDFHWKPQLVTRLTKKRDQAWYANVSGLILKEWLIFTVFFIKEHFIYRDFEQPGNPEREFK
jgi:hypothetical protein